DGLLYNSAFVVDSDGIRLRYRKRNLFGEEGRFFSAGGAAPAVIRCEGVLVGVLVCYDLEFPELVKSVSDARAQLLCVPTNWEWTKREGDLRGSVEKGLAIKAALESGVAVAACDRVGQEAERHWAGASVI